MLGHLCPSHTPVRSIILPINLATPALQELLSNHGGMLASQPGSGRRDKCPLAPGPVMAGAAPG